MTFVPEPELYSFMLRGYHLFSERLPSAWIGDINHIIDEMNASNFDQFRYSKVAMEPMYDWDGKQIQIVARNIMEADAIFNWINPFNQKPGYLSNWVRMQRSDYRSMMVRASGQENWNWADNKPATTPPQPSPFTGMDATLQLSRYPAGSTSTAYSSGLQSDRQDGDSENSTTQQRNSNYHRSNQAELGGYVLCAWMNKGVIHESIVKCVEYNFAVHSIHTSKYFISSRDIGTNETKFPMVERQPPYTLVLERWG